MHDARLRLLDRLLFLLRRMRLLDRLLFLLRRMRLLDLAGEARPHMDRHIAWSCRPSNGAGLPGPKAALGVVDIRDLLTGKAP